MRTVPAPTRIPSVSARSWWNSSRSVSSLIGAVRPSSVALPSAELTMFTARNGLPAGARPAKSSPLAACSTVTCGRSGNSRRSSTPGRLVRALVLDRVDPADERDARSQHPEHQRDDEQEPEQAQYAVVVLRRQQQD